MKFKIQIALSYKGIPFSDEDVYYSNIKEVDNEEYLKIKEYVTLIAQGDVSFMALERGENEHFFTKEILSKSVITIIKHNIISK